MFPKINTHFLQIINLTNFFNLYDLVIWLLYLGREEVALTKEKVSCIYVYTDNQFNLLIKEKVSYIYVYTENQFNLLIFFFRLKWSWEFWFCRYAYPWRNEKEIDTQKNAKWFMPFNSRGNCSDINGIRHWPSNANIHSSWGYIWGRKKNGTFKKSFPKSGIIMNEVLEHVCFGI